MEETLISPYPQQYETTAVTKGGLEVLVRPIKPEDEQLLSQLFNTLSRESIYFRFFGPIKSLPRRVLIRFTHIDYDLDVVLVALDRGPTGDRILGVCRLTRIPHTRKAEVAVVVGDPWQGRGVGSLLLDRSIVIARERGIECLWSMVLPENTTMLSLARQCGFNVKRDAAAGVYEITIHLP